MGVSKQRLPNPLSLPRMSPDVSRHLTESHVTLFRPYPLSALLSFLLFFPVLCLRFRYHQNSFRHSKFLLLYTPANNDDPARFLFPISLFPRSTYSPRSSDFRFCYRIQRSVTPIFLFFVPSLYSFVLFPLSLVFGFGFVIFFALSQFLLILFFLSISWRPQSHLSIRHESIRVYPFFELFLLFFSLICFFRIFRIRFSARPFYVSRSFARIVPGLFNLFLYFVLSLFFFPAATFFNSSFSLFPIASPSSIYFDRS